MRKIVLLVSFLLFSVNIFGQENVNLKETFMDAEYYILYEDFREALPLYQKLYNNGINNAYINYRIGQCYLQIPGQKKKSIPYLKQASQNISPKFKEGSFKETAAPNRTLFYLANAYQKDNQLNKAIEFYQSYEASLEADDIYNIDYVEKQIQTCINAKELIKNPVKIQEINLGATINDEFPNIRPVVSANDDIMLYTTSLKFYDAVYFSRKINGQWTEPENLTPVIKSDGNFYPSSLTPDGKTMVLYKNEQNSGDIYISKYKNDSWQVPEKLNKNINSKGWETNACLSADGKIIYFVSDRKDGFGGLDIFQSIYNEEKQTWDEATNLGPEINTPFNEETPVISKDGKTLYFSSQGHYNMGGFDIFYSNKIKENEWSTPVNIGYPINTTDDDLLFYPVKQGNLGYISRFRENGFGQEDIIQLKIFSPDQIFFVHVYGAVTLQDNQIDFNKKDFRIHVVDSSKALVIDTLFLNEKTGEFNTELKPGTYQFIFRSTEYKQIIKTLVIPADYSRNELSFNVELIPLAAKTDEYLTIKSIFFDFSDHTLTKDAKIELKKLYNLMVKYPSLYIEVIGHSDAIGSDEYNKKLSIKRARSVIDYLSQKGIEQKRLIAKGAGKVDPIVINANNDGSDNPEGRKFNRRVEMKILKLDKKLVSKDEVNISENSKHKNLTYCVLFLKQNEKLPENYFDQYDELKKYSVNEYQNTKFIYTLGNSKQKSELIKIFNTLLELGFEDAEIISNYDLENILDKNKTQSEILESRSDIPIYGIQLKAMHNPIDLKFFKPLDVKEIKCLDGYYRYIYGEFESYNNAKTKLKNIIKQGYTDAFIIKINELK